MDNKGTQALLLSDVSIIREITQNRAMFSVSTGDIQGVRALEANIGAIVPPLLDIPYQKADSMAKKYGFMRSSFKYKVFASGLTLFMLIQAVLSVLSVFSIKAGAKGLYRHQALEKINESDLVVSYSDENFKETASSLPLNFSWILSWWSMLISRTWQVLMAKSLGKTVVMFPNSVGPFRTMIGRFLTRLALNSCDFVLIRESVSYDIVRSLRVRSNILLTADTALLFKSKIVSPQNNSSSLKIGVCPGVYGNSLSEKDVNRYVLAHSRALDKYIEKHKVKVFFLPHFVIGFAHDDLQICRRIVSKMRHRDEIEIVYVPSVEEFKAILDGMYIVISSKMHPAVLAASGFIPIVCVVYDHKQTGFFSRLNMTDCILDVGKVSEETLSSKIDYVWNNREELHDSLKIQIPLLQNNVRFAIRTAVTPFLAEKLGSGIS